jgi:hypothetical protein
LNIFLFSLYTDPCFELSELLRQHFVTAAVALHIPIGGTSGEIKVMLHSFKPEGGTLWLLNDSTVLGKHRNSNK